MFLCLPYVYANINTMQVGSAKDLSSFEHRMKDIITSLKANGLEKFAAAILLDENIKNGEEAVKRAREMQKEQQEAELTFWSDLDGESKPTKQQGNKAEEERRRRVEEARRRREEEERRRIIEAPNIKYGESVQIQSAVKNAFIGVDGNNVWAGKPASFKIEGGPAGQSIHYGDKIKLKAGSLYLGRTDKKQLIYAMNCYFYGLKPEATEFEVRGGEIGKPVQNGNKIQLFAYGESLRFEHMLGKEIFSAPDKWTMPKGTNDLKIIRVGK